ncbi:MAG: xanthine dehydrogenase family protein subunit M [Betaproteobacteria bacterium]|nr:xanthine dehydrogenase family protein subunit M [Betaproteobacteria bacterium]
MYDFNYHQPKSVAEAGKLLAADNQKPLAGGMSLLPTLKLRLNRVDGVVDLAALADLQGIRREGDTLIIGATTPHAMVATSADVQQAIPALAKLAESIGDPLVRNRGTIGGSIAHADPGADYPSAVLGLGATVVTNQRQIAGDAFFTGLFETALQPGEIITAVRFPIPEKSGHAKLRQPASRFAIAGVFVSKRAHEVRVAVTGVGPHVFRLTQAEAALAKSFAPAALDGITLDAAGLNSDIHASNVYRANAAVEMTRRAVAAAS